MIQQVGTRDGASGGSDSVNLSHSPEDFRADQSLELQPHVGQSLLYGWDSGHLQVAVAADSMLDRSLQIDAQRS